MSGIVVDHKSANVRYAISEDHFNPKIHTKVRDLKPGETVIGFTPKRIPTATATPTAATPEKGKN